MSEDKRFCEMINDKEWIDYKFEYENNQRVMKDLYKQLDLYKSVIEEVRERSKLERKTALSLNQHYAVSIIDSVLQILDKAKDSDD